MKTVHLINCFHTANGGAEWRTIELYRILSQVGPVKIWSAGEVPPQLAALAPIHKISPKTLSAPLFGTFVFIGAYYWLSRWFKYALPKRVIILHNTFGNDDVSTFISRAKNWRIPFEMVYACDEARDDAGYPGPVQLSPIDLLRFKPLAHEPRDVFTIGRMSRPEPVKFHPGDPAFFIRLAADGCKVRVMGGECLLPKISPGSGVEIINGGSVPPQVFLNSLDCFFYRTDPDWFETFGRVVLEAMACGLPVVCEADAGYAPYIKSGENGFLFHTEAEAEAQIAALRADPELRARMGAAARRSVEAMYDGEYRRRLQEFYFGTANFSTDAATAG